MRGPSDLPMHGTACKCGVDQQVDGQISRSVDGVTSP